MLSFKIEPLAHARLSHWSGRLFLLAFVVCAAWLAYTALSNYRLAGQIMSDHSVVSAPVTVASITEESGRKGRTSLMYHFSYTFEVKGHLYQGSFSAIESNAGPYLGENVSVEVAYSNADPARFDRLERLQDQAAMGGLLGRLAFAVLGSALLALILHLLVVAKLFVPRVQIEPQAS